MDIRIDKKVINSRTIIEVTGELRGRGVVELKRLCEETTGPLTLDLTNLVSSQSEGLHLLQSLKAQGVDLVGLSPYLRLQLSQEATNPR